ncbi:MAG: MFS transporter, partial [Anaerolineae bacterium]|nr:MFS transporter [Anaerolineae bacterium]
GTLVDRWNRRAVMMTADALIALATVGLALLFAANRVESWHIYAIMFVRSAGSGFHWPAMQASTSLMVPPEHLARVNGLNEALRGGMNVLAPPLGALLLELLPMQGVLAVDVISAGLAILPLTVIAVPQPDRTELESAARPSVRADFAAGLRYVWSWPGLRVLLFMAMAINFCLFPAGALMPLLVKEHFGGEALQLGWMQSGSGLGMLVGGLLLGAWGGFRRRVVTSMIGLTGLGIGLLVVGLSPGPAFGLALVALSVAGVMQSIHGGPLFAALQATVAPEMQGRVLSLISSSMSAIAPISLAIAGPLSDATWPGVWYVVGGGLCIVMGLGAFAVRPLMALEDGPPGAGSARDVESGCRGTASPPDPLSIRNV